MGKLIYLAKRKADYSPMQFAARWRKHGSLAMSLPFFKHFSGYVQADVVHPSPLPGAAEDYDGIGMLWAPSEEFWRDPSPEDLSGVEAMLEDEKETFAGPIPQVSLMVDEEIARHTGEGRTTAYLYFKNSDRARKLTGKLVKILDGGIEAIVLNTGKDLTAFAEPELPYPRHYRIIGKGWRKISRFGKGVQRRRARRCRPGCGRPQSGSLGLMVRSEHAHPNLTGTSPTSEALTAWCKKSLAHYKVPTRWHIVENPLPRTRA